MQLLNNRYRFEKVLGEGGMGRVYLTTDMQTDQLVATKECIIKSDNPKIVKRINREYYFMSKISHPNIIKGLDFFRVQGKYFIVMEYVEGVTLQQLINKYPRSINFDKQLEIAKSVCSAVAKLNESGIIHRDLKPANIILQGGKLSPKILDLGIAKAVNSELTTLTQTGSIVGTPSYISPEQLDSTGVKKNTDVFSLGVIFYQFFSWQQYSPFYAGNIVSTIDKVCNLELPRLDRIVNENDNRFPLLVDTVEKALKKNASERIQSVNKMFSMLWGDESGVENEVLKLLSYNRNVKKIKIIDRNLKFSRTQTKKRQQKKNFISISMILALLISIVLLVNNLGVLHKDNRILVNVPEKRSSSEYKIDITNKIKRSIKQDRSKKEAIDSKKYYDRGNEHYKSGKYDLAVRDFTKAIKLNPSDSLAYRRRASVYYKLEKYNLVIRDCSKAIEVNPNRFAYSNRGIVYTTLGKYDLAIKDFTKAIELNPNDSLVYSYRGEAYSLGGKYNLAIKDYEKSIELYPENASRLYFKIKQLREKLSKD